MTSRPGRSGRRWNRLRLALAALALLMLFWVLALGKATRDRVRDTGADPTFPLPAQAAAIAELMERTPEMLRPGVLAAVNSPDLQVSFWPDEPAPDAGGAPRLPDVERVIGRYLDALGERPVAVYVAARDESRASPRLRVGVGGLVSSDPLRMEIGLIGGGVLRLETQGDLARRVYNWPIGFGAGLVSVILAAFALWALWKETRPLGALGDRLDSFAAAPNPEPMPEEGPETVRGVIGAFNRMQARIAELLTARSAMLGALGHDLRTYLTRLRLRIEMIDDPDQRVRAERDLAEMGAVLENALAFARLDAAALESQPLDLAAIAEAALGETGDQITGPRPAMVLGDRAALRRVLDNLISNARRHGQGVDHIAVERQGEAIHCRIADKGPGFPPGPIRARLLDPFTRGDAARTLDTPGSGLGLAIAARLVEAMGGEISLEDREGGGGEVVFKLPAAS